MTFHNDTPYNGSQLKDTHHNDNHLNGARHNDTPYNGSQLTDTRHNDNHLNDARHNDTLYNGSQLTDTRHNDNHLNDARHNDTLYTVLSSKTLIIMTLNGTVVVKSCQNAECRCAESRGTVTKSFFSRKNPHFFGIQVSLS